MKRIAMFMLASSLLLTFGQPVFSTESNSSRKALIELDYERKEIETKAKISLSKIDAEESRSLETAFSKSGFPKEIRSERDIFPEHQLAFQFAKIMRDANLKFSEQRVQTRLTLASKLKEIDTKIADLRFELNSKESKSSSRNSYKEYVLALVASQFDEKIDVLEAQKACLKEEAKTPSEVVDKRISESVSQFSALSKQSREMAEGAMAGGSFGAMMLTAQSLSMQIPMLMERAMPGAVCENAGEELKEKHELKRLKLKRDVSLKLADLGLKFHEPSITLFAPSGSDYLF